MKRNAAKDVLGRIPAALGRIKRNPENLVKASLADAFFFIAYGIVTAPIFSRIVDHAIIIGSIVSEKAPAVVRGAAPSFSGIIASDPQASAMLNQLFMLYLLLAAAVYIVYVFFQGISWKISAGIAGRKISFHEYMKKFAVLNIFWIALFFLYHLLSLYSDLRASALMTFSEDPGAMQSVVAVLLFAILYFAFVSYSLIGAKKEGIRSAFRAGTRGALYILPAFGVIAIVYFALQRIIDAIGSYDTSLMVLVGIFTMIPAMTWARVYLMLVVEKAK